MDVRCERCTTQYELDDSRVTEAGINVKCTSCGHVFRIHKGAHEPPPRPWRVRRPSGEVLSCPDLFTLQQWILDHQVSREDAISRTGDKWKVLGDIGELSNFFQMADDSQPTPPGPLVPIIEPVASAPMVPPPEEQLLRAPPASEVLHPDEPAAAVAQGSFPSLDPFAPNLDPFAPNPYPPSAAEGNVEVAPLEEPPPVATEPAPSVLESPPAEKVASPEPPAALPTPTVAAAPDPQATSLFMKLAVALSVVATLGAVGFYAYTFHLRPAQLAQEQQEREARELAERALDEALAREEAEAARKKAEEAALAQAEADGGVPPEAEAQPSPPPGQTLQVVAQERGAGGKAFRALIAEAERLRMNERPEAALKAYNRAARLAPRRPEPLAGRGLCHLDLDQPIQAERAFLGALKLDSRYGVALMGLAETYRVQRKKAEAIKFYRRYLEVAPNGSEARAARSAIERLQK